jgi:hypothetical protein
VDQGSARLRMSRLPPSVRGTPGSNLVHPSSYDVNYPPEEIDGWVYRDAFTIYLQLYAHELLERSRVDAEIPVDVIDEALGQPADPG